MKEISQNEGPVEEPLKRKKSEERKSKRKSGLLGLKFHTKKNSQAENFLYPDLENSLAF